MRVFITSTPAELEVCQIDAVQIVRELGHEPILRHPVPRPGLDPVADCSRQIAKVDAMLAIIGFRRAGVPAGAVGGDGLRSWTSWEVGSAFEHRIPVVALLAREVFSPEREADPEAAALMSDLRGELARLGETFGDRDEFRVRVEAALRSLNRDSWTPGVTPGELRLRRFAPPELPPMPYPVLLPYSHPELMAGREQDLRNLRRTLALPVTVVGLHAASGTGKSSLLAGGLVPTLRAEGRPVAFEHYPTEPGLTARLLGDLLHGEQPNQTIDVRDPREFTDRLLAVRRLADKATPLLVIDQFEDLLQDAGHRTLAELGPLMAATAQRLPGLDGPVCRWLLAYRQAYHGQVVEWLEDVLRQARAAGRQGLETLPHDLSSSRFTDWQLQPLGTPPGGSGDALEAATRIFLHAIEKPLSHEAFPWTFAPGEAARLAGAFGQARLRRPDDPLAPELQVVLAHLLEQSSESGSSGPETLTVPENADELIDRALQQHLRRALDRAFPHSLDATARLDRTRALLVLRELADVHGSRDQGQPVHLLAEALGNQGHEILETLSTAHTRLVVRRPQAGAQAYQLAHDRLAEVLVQVVDEGGWAELDIDETVLGLRRFVALQSRLFASGDGQQATAVSASQFQGIEANQEVLLWSQPHQAWWQACRLRHQAERTRMLARRTAATVLILAVATIAWAFADHRARYESELDNVSTGRPETAFAALDRLTLEPGYPAETILERLRQREQPFDVFEQGLGGVEASQRARALVRIAELAQPILQESPEDFVLIASLVWALDFFVQDPALKNRALQLRNKALAPLRKKHPPPQLPEPGDPHWADIPAGTFWQGAGPDEGRHQTNMQNEYPRHQVSLSAFRIMTHELTRAQYRLLVPDHQGPDDLPVGGVNWFEAYTYAAWLGGRLPTESEWEYAARAGCAFSYCRKDGSEATLNEVAWWIGNYAHQETDLPPTIKQLKPNPFGLWDIYGSVWEWTANWYHTYPENHVVDPSGPSRNSDGYRTARSGSYYGPKEWVVASGRAALDPAVGTRDFGIRIVIPSRAPPQKPSTAR